MPRCIFILKDLEKVLLLHYPNISESLKNYRKVFRRLKKLSPTDTTFKICINEGLDDESYHSVSGKNGTLNKELDSSYAEAETDYAIEMMDWSLWLGMDIDKTALADYSPLEIATHCLWEMTFYGIDQTVIKKQKSRLQKSIEELDNMTEEEKAKKLIPWEKIKEELLGKK